MEGVRGVAASLKRAPYKSTFTYLLKLHTIRETPFTWPPITMFTVSIHNQTYWGAQLASHIEIRHLLQHRQHWLKVLERIHFNLAVLVYRSHHQTDGSIVPRWPMSPSVIWHWGQSVSLLHVIITCCPMHTSFNHRRSSFSGCWFQIMPSKSVLQSPIRCRSRAVKSPFQTL